MATEIDHFKGKNPSVLKIYEKLIAVINNFGPIKIDPKKTSIHLGNRFGFAGVYTRQDYINLEVHLDHKLKNSRIAKVEQASANRYHHTIKVDSLNDIDKELVAWLKQAYDLKK